MRQYRRGMSAALQNWMVLLLAALILLCGNFGWLREMWAARSLAEEDALPTAAESAPPLREPIPAARETVSESAGLFGRGKPEEEPSADPGYIPEIRNETSFVVDPAAIPVSAVSLPDSDNHDPQVLIVHTHTSESYLPDETYFYVPDDNDRTLDTAYNVVAVGDRVQEVLESAGISVLHDKTINDYPTYSGSYNRMLEIIELYLAEYPSIQVVLDLHRDAILYEDGTRQAVSTWIGDRSAAQVMLVVGTDEGGLPHDDWEQNLAFAMALQETADASYPGLMRPINLRSSRFNQHVSPGALIVEMGSSGNTLGEALFGAALFANVLVDTLRS